MNTEASGTPLLSRLEQTWKIVSMASRTAASKVRESLTGLISLRTLLAFIIGLVFLHLFGVISIPFFPFTTTGKIYVDSPEVYTRERLVNDRYDQDFWLRKQLEGLAESKDLQLVVAEESVRASAGVQAGSSQEGKTEEKQDGDFDASNQPRQLSFGQEFRVVSGIRDMIRQQILENMLDDRHDLTGNSVFGLKFDTTVIPGSNTRRRAIVHVSLPIDTLFPPRGENSTGLGEHVYGWETSQLVARKHPECYKDDEAKPECDGILEDFKACLGQERPEPGCKAVRENYNQCYEVRTLCRARLEGYEKQEYYYQAWQDDLERRLNRAEDSVYEGLKNYCNKEPARAFYDRLTGETLNVVLGLPKETFSRLNNRRAQESDGSGIDASVQGEAKPLDGPIKLKNPWDRFFQIFRYAIEPDHENPGNSCHLRVWFEVQDLTEPFTIDRAASSQSGNGESPETPSEEKVPEEPVAPAGMDGTDGGQRTTGFSSSERQGNPVNEQGPELEATSKEQITKLLDTIFDETPWEDEDVRALKDHVANELDSIFLAKLLDSIFKGTAWTEVEDDEDALAGLIETEDGKWMVMIPSWQMAFRDMLFEEVVPKYPLTTELIEKMLGVNEKICSLSFRQDERCNEENLKEISLPSGLFNFIEGMSGRDAYSYAIFPKNDLVGVFAETSAQLSATAPATGFFDLARRLRESRTASVLVGYGDGKGRKRESGSDGSGAGRSIDFGWVISARGDMEPTQKSQLALVSVPAWTDTLKLRIAVGWLDRDGDPEFDEEEIELEISVPPHFEVFDSIFQEDARVTLGPSIRQNEMDKDIYVRAGQRARILIPGSRLWRSASVTLGAQMADRIRVLPNMEGIIAVFTSVDPPYAAFSAETESTSTETAGSDALTPQADGPSEKQESQECPGRKHEIEDKGMKARPVRLRVWTSEGVAQANRSVCVVYDPEEVLKGSSEDRGQKQTQTQRSDPGRHAAGEMTATTEGHPQARETPLKADQLGGEEGNSPASPPQNLGDDPKRRD